MQRLPILPACLFLLCAGLLIPVFAKPPEELKKAPIDDLKMEADEQIESLGKWTASPATYKENVDDIRRAAGVLAVLGQAIAEHPQAKSQKLAPLALRDAALKLAGGKDYPSAMKAIQNIRAAAQGEAPKTAAKPVAWKDLISSEDMMHVINSRNSQLRRAARRSRNPAADSRHALTIAMLTLAMAEQEDDPDWKKYATDFQHGMTDLAASFKAKDKAGIQKHLAFATQACTDCHAKFRAAE